MNKNYMGMDRETLAFYAAVALLLVPIWLFPVFATQDGPVHIYNAELIRQLLADKGAWFSDWVVINSRPDPTWPPHLLLAGLVALLPVDFAEKLFQTACIASLPLAARYALGSLGEGAGQWAWLSLPLAFNFPFHMGFYSFCMGLSFSMLMLGYWLRHPEAWGLRTIAVQAGLALAAYFSHVFAMLAFGIAMLPMALLRLWRGWRAQGTGGVLKAQFLPWVLAFAPALLLAAEFLLARPQETYPIDYSWRFKALAQFFALQSFRDIEEAFSVAVSLSLFVFAAVASIRALRAREPDTMVWIAAVGLIFAMAMFMPESRMLSGNGMRGGAYFVPRIGTVFYLCPLFLIAAGLGRPRFARSVMVLGVTLALAGMALRWPVYLDMNEQLAEYRTAESHVNAGEVVVALNVQHGSFLEKQRNLTAYSDPTRHEVNRIAARRGAFSLNNYQQNTGYFPLQHPKRATPIVLLGNLEAEPPMLDIPRFERMLGRPIDVLLVWMAESKQYDPSELLAGIRAAGFERIYVSEPNGLMWIYRRPPGLPGVVSRDSEATQTSSGG